MINDWPVTIISEANDNIRHKSAYELRYGYVQYLTQRLFEELPKLSEPDQIHLLSELTYKHERFLNERERHTTRSVHCFDMFASWIPTE